VRREMAMSPAMVARMKGCARTTVVRAIKSGELDADVTTTANGRKFYAVPAVAAKGWTPRPQGAPKKS